MGQAAPLCSEPTKATSCIVSDQCCSHCAGDRVTDTVKVDLEGLAASIVATAPSSPGKENNLPSRLPSEDNAGPPAPLKATVPAPKSAAETCADSKAQLHATPPTTPPATPTAAFARPPPHKEAENGRTWESGWLGASAVTDMAEMPSCQDEIRALLEEPDLISAEFAAAIGQGATSVYEGTESDMQTIPVHENTSPCSPTLLAEATSECRSSLTWASINDHVISSMSTSGEIKVATDASPRVSPARRSTNASPFISPSQRSTNLSSRGSSVNLPSPAFSWSTSHSMAHSQSEARMLEAQSLLANMLQPSSEETAVFGRSTRDRSRRRKSAPPLAITNGEAAATNPHRRNLSCESKAPSLQPLNGLMPRFPAGDALNPANSRNAIKRP